MYVNCPLQYQAHRCASSGYHYYYHIVLTVKSMRKRKINFHLMDNVYPVI